MLRWREQLHWRIRVDRWARGKSMLLEETHPKLRNYVSVFHMKIINFWTRISTNNISNRYENPPQLNISHEGPRRSRPLPQPAPPTSESSWVFIWKVQSALVDLWVFKRRVYGIPASYRFSGLQFWLEASRLSHKKTITRHFSTAPST